MSSCIKLILVNVPIMSFSFISSVFIEKVDHGTLKNSCKIKGFPVILKIREEEIINSAL